MDSSRSAVDILLAYPWRPSSIAQASPKQTPTSTSATSNDRQTFWLSAAGSYALCCICYLFHDFIRQYIQEVLYQLRSHHSECHDEIRVRVDRSLNVSLSFRLDHLWQLVSANAFEMLWTSYSVAPLFIRYTFNTPLGRRLSLKLHQSLRFTSRLFAASTIVPPFNLQEIQEQLDAMSSRASQWYRAVGQKVLQQERMMKAVSAQISVMVAWCARSFETLTEQIRELDQRVKQQEATLVDERARIRQLYTAIEPIKNGYLSSQSVLERMQPDVSTVSGGLGNVQGAIDRLTLRFDTFERRATTSDNRIEALELQIKVLRSSLEILRQHGSVGGFNGKEALARR